MDYVTQPPDPAFQDPTRTFVIASILGYNHYVAIATLQQCVTIRGRVKTLCMRKAFKKRADPKLSPLEPLVSVAWAQKAEAPATAPGDQLAWVPSGLRAPLGLLALEIVQAVASRLPATRLLRL